VHDAIASVLASPIGSNVVVFPVVMTQNDRTAFLEAECAKLRSENDKLRAIIERREVRDAALALLSHNAEATQLRSLSFMTLPAALSCMKEC
jgi:hypothetical protein